jgi:hypothetical protein
MGGLVDLEKLVIFWLVLFVKISVEVSEVG